MRHFFFGLLVIAASTPAFAQNFNIDVGNQPTYSPLPSAAYGAGAGQAGTWNGVSGLTTGPFALVDITGAATAVTFPHWRFTLKIG